MRPKANTRTIYYRVEGDDVFPLTLAVEWSLATVGHRETIAELAAKDFHDEHDGWEATYPLTLTLHETSDGPALGQYEILREYDPTFWAREQKP